MKRTQKQKIIAGWLVFWGLAQAISYYWMDNLFFLLLGILLILIGLISYYAEVTEQSDQNQQNSDAV